MTPTESGAAPPGAGAPAERSFAAPSGEYARVFETTKDVLRDAGFVLARVDAKAGVIVTAPLASSGFATPWIGAEATFNDSVEAVANAERRIVEVRFLVPGAPGAPTTESGAGSPGGAALEAGAVAGEVSARVVRVRSPGRRVESASIRLTSFASDASVRERGLEPDFQAPEREDPALAERVASRIRSALARGAG